MENFRKKQILFIAVSILILIAIGLSIIYAIISVTSPIAMFVGNEKRNVELFVAPHFIRIPRSPRFNPVTEVLALSVPVIDMPNELISEVKRLALRNQKVLLRLSPARGASSLGRHPRFDRAVKNDQLLVAPTHADGYVRYNYKKLTGANARSYFLVSNEDTIRCVKLCTLDGEIPNKLHYKFHFYPEDIARLAELDGVVKKLIIGFLKN